MADKKDPLRDYAWYVVGQQVKDLVRHEGGVYAVCQIEHLHRFRVALRRISNLFGIFQKELSSKSTKRYDRIISAAAKRLGTARDLDIHIDLLKKNYRLFSQRDQNEIKKIITSLQKERFREQKNVIAVLKFLKKEKIISSLQGQAVLRFRPSILQDKREFYATGEAKILKRLKKFLELSQYASQPQNGKKLHRMRIGAKKLRYTLESFEKVYGAQALRFAEQARELQTELGGLHDAETFVNFLKEHRGRKAQELKILCKRLEDFFVGKKRCAYEKFFSLWQKNQKEKTWDKLSQWVTSYKK